MGKVPAGKAAHASQRFLKNLSRFRAKPWKVPGETSHGFWRADAAFGFLRPKRAGNGSQNISKKFIEVLQKVLRTFLETS